MGNTNRSGLLMHDASPAAFAAAGRRGNAAAMAKAKRLMHAGPEPAGLKYGSDNHHLIQALNNALVFKEYEIAEEWLAASSKGGIGEGGSLYFPSGDGGYCLPLIVVAEDDGKKAIAQGFREYVARAHEWMEPMALPKGPSKITSVLPGGEPEERDYKPTGQGGHIFFPGSRALFGHSGAGAGWYAEGPATVFYQWITGTNGRTLPGRYAGFIPDNVENTWDSWPWMTAVLKGWIEPSLNTQPKSMAAAFRERAFEVDASPGPYKLRFGMEVVRFADGSMLCTCTHKTASPKPPVVWVEYHAPSNSVRLAAPDGLRTYGSTGKGEIKIGGGEVWARGWTADGVVKESRKYKLGKVVSHLVLSAKSKGDWKRGKLHPKDVQPPAPPPGPPGPEPTPPSEEEESCRWYDIFCYLRRIFG